LILENEPIGDSHYLPIDKMVGFEKAVSQSRNEAVLNFIEADSVSCDFTKDLWKFVWMPSEWN